jgi:c(7)-type cytochrome triheme protein
MPVGGRRQATGGRKEVKPVMRSWKACVILAAVVALVGFFGAVVVGKAFAQAKGPADFDFDGKGGGKVSFSHEKHLAKGGKCTDCHTKIFKMTKGQRSAPKMAEMEAGQSCGTCHNAKTAFDVKDKANCTKCHQKS